MKIVHVTQFFHPLRGYQENHIAILQASSGHEVTIICTDNLKLWGIDRSEMISMDKDFSDLLGVKIIRLEAMFEISTRLFVRGLYLSLNSLKIELLTIHAVSLPMSLMAMKWGSRHKVKMIVDDHMVKAGSFNKYSRLFHGIFKHVFQGYLQLFKIRIYKWIAVSQETKVFMVNNYGIKDRIDIVPLGYDGNNVFYDREGGESWLKENDLPIDVPYILYIGKFDDMKNPIDLLEPFRNFLNANIDFKLLMVGDPSETYLKKLKNKIDELNLDEYVYHIKSVSNNKIREVFSVSEVAIWPHGSSMAMLEAMACDCPVIAPEIDVNIERLQNNQGAMFKENSSQDLVEKINYVLENKPLIVSNAKKWVNNYAWSSLVDNFY